MIQLGRVCELARYPIKSMAGVSLESAVLGWHGLEGDRRLAFRRTEDTSGFPWVSASQHPQLLLYRPLGENDSGEPLPTHVLTPSAMQVEPHSAELREEITTSYGKRVELMHLRQGIFDDAAVSVISQSTIKGIGREAGMELDSRRFRANIIVDTDETEPFREDDWVGGTLVFGKDETAAAVSVTAHDVRCMIINLDPDTAKQDARVLKTVVALNSNNAGVYGSTLRCGTIRVGHAVRFIPSKP